MAYPLWPGIIPVAKWKLLLNHWLIINLPLHLAIRHGKWAMVMLCLFRSPISNLSLFTLCHLSHTTGCVHWKKALHLKPFEVLVETFPSWPVRVGSSGKVSGAQEGSQRAKFMRPTWGPPGSSMGLILAPWILLSGLCHIDYHPKLKSCEISFFHNTH